MSPTGEAEAVRLDLGDVLGTTAQAVGGRIAPFLLLGLLGAAPGSFLLQFMNHLLQGRLVNMTQMAPGSDPDAVFSMLGSMLAIYGGLMGVMVIHVVLTYIAQSVIIRGTVDWILGKPRELGETIRATGPRLPSVMGIVLVRGILQFALMMPGALISVVMMMGIGGAAGAAGAGGHSAEGAVAAVGLAMVCAIPLMLILMIVPMVIVSILLFVAEPAAIHGKLGPVDSMSRSIALTRKNRLRIFGLILIVGTAFVIAACGLGMFSSLVTFATGGLDTSTGMMRAPSVIGSLVGALVNTVMYMVQAITFAPLTAVIYSRLAGLDASVDVEQVAEVFA